MLTFPLDFLLYSDIWLVLLKDAIQKSELEFKQHVENLEQDVKRLTERNQELEQRLRAYLEQEHQMLEENQLQKNRSTELNKELQQQLREVKTLTDSSSKIKQEVAQ